MNIEEKAGKKGGKVFWGGKGGEKRQGENVFNFEKHVSLKES